jgi:hypothetical protein
MTNEISWRHRNPSNPNRPAEPGRTLLPIPIARYEKVVAEIDRKVIAISIQRLAAVNTSWVKEEVARKQAIREAAERKVAEARRRSLFYRRFGSEPMLPGVSIAKSERFVSTKPRLLGSTLKRQLPLDLLHAFPTVDSQE